MHAVLTDAEWTLKFRTTGNAAKKLPAKKLWEDITMSAWASADPGFAVRYDDQRVAHLPERWTHQREQSVLRIYVFG